MYLQWSSVQYIHPAGNRSHCWQCVKGIAVRETFKTSTAMTFAVLVLQCSNCLPGYFCAEGQEPILCPRGHFCIGSFGTGLVDDRTLEEVPEQCPAGSYSNASGLSNVSQCMTCDPGKYCSLAATAPGGAYCLVLWGVRQKVKEWCCFAGQACAVTLLIASVWFR